jgi:tight adherence protein B
VSLESLPAALLTTGGLLAALAAEARERSARLAIVGASPSIPPPGASPRRPGRELITHGPVRFALALAGCAAGSVVAGPPGAIAGVGVALAAPVLWKRRAAARDRERIEAQLSDAVATIAAGMRAGRSLAQAIALAAADADPPLGPALREIVDRASLGIPLSDSLGRFADTLPGADVRLVAGVLGLHGRTGGDLPMVLDRLARTLRERRAAAREVRSMTAQARLSGAILGCLPLGFFLFLSATSRDDLAAAYHSRVGVTAIGFGLVMQAGAFLWIRRLLRIA